MKRCECEFEYVGIKIRTIASIVSSGSPLIPNPPTRSFAPSGMSRTASVTDITFDVVELMHRLGIDLIIIIVGVFAFSGFWSDEVLGVKKFEIM